MIVSHHTAQASLSSISVEPVLHFDLGLWIRSGVDQVSQSILAVLFPQFSVTLLTAIVLPLKECVSNRCKAFTLFHLLSCIAFTICVWWLLITLLHFFQFILCKCILLSVDVLAIKFTTIICFSPFKVSSNSLIIRDHNRSLLTFMRNDVSTPIYVITT